MYSLFSEPAPPPILSGLNANHFDINTHARRGKEKGGGGVRTCSEQNAADCSYRKYPDRLYNGKEFRLDKIYARTPWKIQLFH